MAFRLKQSTASQVVMFMAFLSADHISVATGVTIAITISKNGAAFGNPNAGATNATEVSNGWYKVTLDATDTATEGPLVIRGTSATIDDVGLLCFVEAAVTVDNNAIADAVLKRDWTAVSGEAARSVLNALRLLRNKWSVSSNVLTVTEEDDATTAWTASVATAAGSSPVTSVDPA